MATNASAQRFKALVASLPGPLKREIFGAVEVGAERMAAAMRSGAAVGPRGALRDSVRTEPDASRLRVTIRAGGPTTTTAHGYDYALGQEFGNEDTPAQPFFWPAYRANRRAVRAGIKRAVGNSLRRQWKA